MRYTCFIKINKAEKSLKELIGLPDNKELFKGNSSLGNDYLCNPAKVSDTFS